MGKAFYLPVTLVVSTSDTIASSRWGLLIGLAEYVSKPVNQSEVLVCRVEALSTPCFTGLYIVNGVNGNGRGFVYVSNGNGNGGLRVSLNGNHVRIYSVIASIPPYVWIPILVVYFALLAYVLWKNTRMGYLRVLSESRVIEFGLLMAITLNVILVGAVYVDQATPRYYLPGVSVEWSFNLDNSTLIARLNLNNVYTLLNATCWYKPPGVVNGFATNSNSNGSNGVNYPLETLIVDLSTIVAIIPRSVYEEYFNNRILEPVSPVPAYLSVYEAIPVYCEFKLDKAVFKASYLITFYWRDLVVRSEGSRVVISNPNPVSINASIHVLDLKKGHFVYSNNMTISALGEEVFDLSSYEPGVYRVIVQYKMLGLVRSRIVEVEVS